MFIPCLPDTLQVIADDFLDTVEFFRRETIVIHQCDGIQPELADFPLAAYMDMPRLVAVKTIKEKGDTGQGNREPLAWLLA